MEGAMSGQEWGMFYRLITEYGNKKISRGLFVIDWGELQKRRGIAVPERSYEKAGSYGKK
jgi:hypothetical protein